MPNLPRKSLLISARGLDPVGSGRQLELVANGLVAAGWRVHLAVTTRGGSVPALLAARGVAVHEIGRRRAVDLAASVRLARLTARLRPGVLLAWGSSQLLPTYGAACGSPGTRLAAHLARPPRRGAAAWSATRYDLLITTVPQLAARLRRQCPAARIVDVPPGIEPAAATGLSRTAVARRLGLRPETTWTLCVAPLVPRSRLERLLWAIDQLGVVRKDLEHVLVGSGPLLERLVRRGRVQEVMDRLVILPHCDVLPDLLREVRLVWQSGEVACGGAILDGMAVGVPAVAVAGDAAQQLIVDGETGWLVPALPESELPRRAFGILEDPQRAAAYAAAAQVRARDHFPAAALVAGHAAALETLLGASAGTGSSG
jgi:glycosyltransferase involved in cell wall biosynthesis